MLCPLMCVLVAAVTLRCCLVKTFHFTKAPPCYQHLTSCFSHRLVSLTSSLLYFPHCLSWLRSPWFNTRGHFEDDTAKKSFFFFFRRSPLSFTVFAFYTFFCTPSIHLYTQRLHLVSIQYLLFHLIPAHLSSLDCYRLSLSQGLLPRENGYADVRGLILS